MLLSAAAPAAAQVERVPAQMFPLAGHDGQPFRIHPAAAGRPATQTRVTAFDVTSSPDGEVAVIDGQRTVRRIGTDGVLREVALPAMYPEAVEAGPDASVLVAGEGIVRRVATDGTVTTVARVHADALAALPDGGVLAVDEDRGVVRRVLPDGQVRRYAGTGDAGIRGDGGPATSARLREPTGVTVLSDGRVLIADASAGRIRQVDPQGIISTVARLETVQDVAAAPDGGFFATDGDGIAQYSSTGVLIRVHRTWAPDFIGRRSTTDRLTVFHDGNVAFTAFTEGLFNKDDQRLWLLRLGASDRALVAVRHFRVARGAVTATVETTQPGTVTLTATGLRGPVRATAAASATGVTKIRLRGRFPVPRQVVRAELRDASGRVAEDRLTAWLGRRLGVRAARAIVSEPLSADDGGGFYVRDCRRRSARRVDCEVAFATIVEPVGRCTSIAAVTLPRTGVPVVRRYRCRASESPFRR